MLLDSFGLRPSIADAFGVLRGEGLVLGRVVRVERGFAAVQTEDGELTVHVPKSMLRPKGDGPPSSADRRSGPRSTPPSASLTSTPVTGDWVAVDARRGAIAEVLPRGACFVRRAAGKRGEPQIVAANVDRVFVLMGLDGDFNLRRLERYLALTKDAGADAVILLTKAGLSSDFEAGLATVRELAAGAPVEAIDVVSGINSDAPLRYLGPGVTAALIGSSGVGKSTLANYLLGADALKTAAVREHDDRGKHTTTRRELFARPWGVIIDTPGMRELSLHAEPESVEAAFPDIAELGASCRFSDCAHEREPDCAVRKAVEDGTLAPSRLASFKVLRAEVEERDKAPRSSRRRGR
ncbi:MAG: ribosome small subunit-dependent GTPase A [Polyangiaceae bacterium]